MCLIVGSWPGVQAQQGGVGGGGVDVLRDQAEHVEDISIVNDRAQLRPRPEAESSIRGFVWVDCYSLEPRHPS